MTTAAFLLVISVDLLVPAVLCVIRLHRKDYLEEVNDEVSFSREILECFASFVSHVQ